MSREPAFAEPTVASMLADEITSHHQGKTLKEIVVSYGLKIKYEHPVNIGTHKRISEYRSKTQEIVVFYKDRENEAIAHELFHFLEKIKGLGLGKQGSEKEAKDFARKIVDADKFC